MSVSYSAPGSPPKETLEFFRSKKLKPGFDYRDVWREEHATAFTIAKAMNIDILETIQGALDQSLAEGLTYKDFAKNLQPSLERLGWWGKSEQTDPVTGKKSVVQLGSPRRLKTIYRANLRTARAAGQWQRIERSKRTQPYLTYELGPSLEHRQQHEAWAGTTLPVDHSFWQTHAPMNGWGCNCRVRTVSRRQYQRLLSQGKIKTEPPQIKSRKHVNKRTGEVIQVPEGIDPGFDFNPGRVARTEHAAHVFGTKVKTASPQIGAYAMENATEFVKSGIADDYRRWVSGLTDRSRQATGEIKLVSAVKTPVYGALKKRGIELDTAAITLRDKDVHRLVRPNKQSRGQALTSDVIRDLPKHLDNPKAVMLDTRDAALIYLFAIGEKFAKVVMDIGHKGKARLGGQLTTIKTQGIHSATLVRADDMIDDRFEVLDGKL